MSENTERCVCCAGPGPCITVDRNQGKTPSPLTREQVEEQLENIHLGSVGVRVKSMACIRKHDAALRLTIAQQAQRIQELEDQRIRYGPICLNCGKDKPCMTEAEANQHGASIPCIFDPAPKELWQRCEQQAQEIERVQTSYDADMKHWTAQLAAMTAERDAAQQRYERQCAGTKSRLEEIVHLRSDCQKLQTLLTASEQEAGRLRNNVELMARDMCSMPSDLYQEWLDSDSQVHFRQWLAERALKGEGCQGDTPPG